MQEDPITVFCLSHWVSFPTLGSNRVVICKENHVLSYNFPYSGSWFYCCLCQQYWIAPEGEPGLSEYYKQCPSCDMIKKAHYYSCDQCNVTLIDSLGEANRQGAHITPWGTPHPHCPGCHELPKSIPQLHVCPKLNALLATARPHCPFCEGGESEEVDLGVVEIDDFRDVLESPRATAELRLRNVGEFKNTSDLSSLSLEELEKKVSARFETEKELRVAAEEAKAELEINLHEMQTLAAQTEERLRKAESELQQESTKRARAEEKINELEARIASETARLMAESESIIQMMGAETRRIEENYRTEIDWIRNELNQSIVLARQAAETRWRQEEASIRQQCQIKIDEAVANSQAAMSNLEETQKKLFEAEVRCQEMENKLSQAENRSQRLFMITKLNFSTAEQIIAETLGAAYKIEEKEGKDKLENKNDVEEILASKNHSADTYIEETPVEVPELDPNVPVDLGDIQFSERLKALFSAAARVNAAQE